MEICMDIYQRIIIRDISAAVMRAYRGIIMRASERA